MDTYETQPMSPTKARMFESWFDQQIGTDIEKNPVDDGGAVLHERVYFVCMELTPKEAQRVKQWEENHASIL